MEDFPVKGGQTQSNYGFFKSSEVTERVLTTYMDSLYCIDEPYEMFGDYESETASNLIVVYEKCDPERRKCKSPEVIEASL